MSLFLDTVKIEVRAGKGGDGAVAFRREKYVPDGGPAGGDGGRGGSIFLVVDEGLNTLMDFRYHRIWKGNPGDKGMNKGMHGRGAEDIYLKVPEGTTVKDAETGEVLADLRHQGDEYLAAKGGRGGRGNIRFATHKNPAPEVAENGEPGEEKTLLLELRVLADVGLIGFPSVGKSTLLSVISNARPKIGAYHFTTLTPNIGMVRVGYGASFVAADMPGLIEGAHAGAGLGIEFLRHIERTRVLLHVIDMSAADGRNPWEDYLTINQELEDYNLRLLERPQIIVANKMDQPDSVEHLQEFKEKLTEKYGEFSDDLPQIFEISALAHTGLTGLLNATVELLEKTPEFPLYEIELPDQTTAYYGFDEDESGAAKREFTVYQENDSTWVLGGEKLERLFKMTNFDHDESVMKFARQLRAMGVDEELRARGARDGDTVRIEKFEFDFVD
ncbi:GTPase ObgE [Lactovum odontotermitis]